MSELVLDNVTKVFDDGGEDIVAVDEVSVDIADGEFLVLVGPSGCGKSTTLRMIAGLETVSRGEIRLDGQVINGRPPRERDIAMVFQSYALYPHMTVRQNMSFGLEESTEKSDDEIESLVTETGEMLGISPLLDRKPGELSGGQQQRVALGRAIVRDPKVFLMDEPLSNLDAKLRSQMRTELQRLQEDLDVTTVYVTHDQTEAMTMGDRIAILNDGVLQQVATPLEAYHQPANLFVAGFIGEPSMNFFETELQGDRLVAENFDYPLSQETREAVGDSTHVTLGVRPEDIELLDSGSASGDHDFETVVDVVEPMGNENNVYLSFESGGDADFVATITGMRSMEGGQPAVARFPESAIHLFDTDSGHALKNRSLDELEETEPRL
ncbi:ABC transporter ATP-binding protein [Halopelagius longus]|uniref:ABC-type D-xylose/L-arabinose transporter n=1 Tax=Halopelagius longus TaxID=1236180 RepID=A0A1H0ZCJ0_9EURY|nr:sn-glycerol-3-phosphate ABC transporter ATP-binding protein UgpC [Halopelagius longus]RDI72939.1 sn-glycerol-3-phosphate ABC transporter ATP-binding protein UgpC [Halopelagius longus]SDQ25124.1 carbohydrate ABC transporter ATP-binding protein, CUT1 family [Halopelagius longus]